MRKIILITVLFVFQISSFAREGMWLPFLIEQGILDEMHSMGSELSARDIYNEDSVSLKDAVLLFGGGCTASFISSKGLLLTNYHCARSYVSMLSDEDKPYLLQGFWAKNMGEELKVPKLTASSLKKVEDYTAFVDSATAKSDFETVKQRLIDSLKKTTSYSYELKYFFGTKKCYLISYQEYTDIRLVASVPESLGNFGGDTDNWMWPRHSADFALFRIYTKDEDSNAVPLNPSRWLEIDLSGIDQNQFTMVYGFPGQTREYLPSVAVKAQIYGNNPPFIEYRGEMLKRISRMMDKSTKHQLKYCALSSRLSNYWKKLQGENWGVIQANTIENKNRFEQSLFADNPRLPGLLDSVAEVATYYSETYTELTHFYEGFFRMNLFQYINYFDKEIKAHESGTLEEILSDLDKRYRNLDELGAIDIDLGYYRFMLESSIGNSKHLPSIFDKIDCNAQKLTEKSVFFNPDKFKQYFAQLRTNPSNIKKRQKKLDKLYQDPFYAFVNEAKDVYRKKVLVEYRKAKHSFYSLTEQYANWLYDNNYMPYPDANGTMRFSFGKVEGYIPRDAVSYNWQTNINGLLQKHYSDTAVYPLCKRASAFFKSDSITKSQTVCFIASNHTSGGNSGSPVLNGKGQLIGLNFDRNWEGTMSDIDYDPSRCRNIAVDIRFILFLLKKYAGTAYLFDELQISDDSHAGMQKTSSIKPVK